MLCIALLISSIGLTGDINNDGIVNLADYQQIAHHWMVEDCGWCRGADLSGNGNVDFTDLAIFMENWLMSTQNQIQVSGITNSTLLNGIYTLNESGVYFLGDASITKLDIGDGVYRWEIRLVTDLYFFSEDVTVDSASPTGLEYTAFGDGSGTVIITEYTGVIEMLTYSSRKIAADGNTEDVVLVTPYLVLFDYHTGDVVNKVTGSPSASETYAANAIAGSQHGESSLWTFTIPALTSQYEYAFRICNTFASAAKGDQSLIAGFIDPKTLAFYQSSLSQGKIRVR